MGICWWTNERLGVLKLFVLFQKEEKTGREEKRTHSVYGVQTLSEDNDTWISVADLTHARVDSQPAVLLCGTHRVLLPSSLLALTDQVTIA